MECICNQTDTELRWLQSIDPQVHQRGIGCLQMWASYYQQMPEMVAIVVLYQRVVPKVYQPDLPSVSRSPRYARPQANQANSQPLYQDQNQQQQSPIQEQLRRAAMQASMNNVRC